MDHQKVIKRQTFALTSLENSIPTLIESAFKKDTLTGIINRGYLSSHENEELGYWFSKFINIRNHLWTIIQEGIHITGGINRFSNAHDYQYFVLSYSAVCNLIRIDKFLIHHVANHSLIQRKLNEALPEHRIGRKQFHYIQKSLVQPSNAIRIHQAHRLLKRKHAKISKAVINTPLENVLQKLPEQERFINLSFRHYLFSWLRSRKLNWKRRGASAKQKSFFSVLEYGGRLTSEISLPSPKKVTPAILKKIETLLEPGDVLITRHNNALTNLFLPGYWPHSALYIGSKEDKKHLKIKLSTEQEKEWGETHSTFEALKDGVHFRSLSDTLNVDSFVVLRPNFTDEQKGQAISRAIQHAGKGYNFDFDFFRSDQLVCTEVIYRAYDGINGFDIPLKERMGRKTLSAEDLLDLTLDTDWAEEIAIFGVGESRLSLISDQQVKPILVNSFRD